MTIRAPLVCPVVTRAICETRGDRPGFGHRNHWPHARVAVSGGSQILGPGCYRVYSADGSFAAAQINNALLGQSGKRWRFRLEVESFAAGTRLVMGDDVGTDITITGAGIHRGEWAVNGPTAIIKRSSGPTDAIVKSILLTPA